MINLLPRERNYIETTIPKDRDGRLPYSNGDRSSVVTKARQLRNKSEPGYGVDRKVLIERLYEELRSINERWTP